jgi:hypothetical protein
VTDASHLLRVLDDIERDQDDQRAQQVRLLSAAAYTPEPRGPDCGRASRSASPIFSGWRGRSEPVHLLTQRRNAGLAKGVPGPAALCGPRHPKERLMFSIVSMIYAAYTLAIQAAKAIASAFGVGLIIGWLVRRRQ